MFGYRVPKPDEIMLVSGRKSTEDEPFKLYRQGKFVLYGFRVTRFLSLTQQKSIVEEPCTTVQGINGIFRAVVAFRIAPDDQSIYAAGQRFLDDQGMDRKTGVAAMAERTGQIFAGHLRSIVGAMTLEDIMQKRQALADQVLEASKLEVGRMGLEIDSFQLTSIDGDQVQAYVAALAAPHTAAVQREAKIKQAQADQAAAMAQQESQRKQAEYQRETQMLQAQYKADTDRAEAEAAQAGPLAQALAQQAVIDMRRQQAEREAGLREQELITEIQRPAEAEATRMRIMAEAEAIRAEAQARQLRITSEAQGDQTKIVAAANAESVKLAAGADAERVRQNGRAESEKVRAIGLAEAEAARAKSDATAANDRAQLQLRQIEIMPEVAKAISASLAGADITMLNGAEGWSQLLSVGIQQAQTLFKTFGTQGSNAGNTTNGQGALESREHANQ